METSAAIERIRKLMAYASDGSASEGEIENALGHARRLMDKFNLEEKDIESPARRQSFYDEIKQHEVYQRANQIDEFDRLLAVVPCIICDVKSYTKHDYRPNKRGKTSRMQVMVFYGAPRDCAIAEALYHELLSTMRAMVRFRYPDDWQRQFSSYCYGFVNRLTERAQELKQRIPQEEGCTAIVVAKEKIIKNWASNNLQLTKRKHISRAGERVNGDAYDAGREDGSRVHLGTNGIQGGSEPKEVT
jgi:disulfide oxidoreductase YuzD